MSTNDLSAALKMIRKAVKPSSRKPNMTAGLQPAQGNGRKGFDLFLTSGPENIFYLTGQQTPGYYTFQCLCVPQQGEPFHILRGLEGDECAAEHLLADIEGYGDDAHPAAAVAASLKRAAGQASASPSTATAGSSPSISTSG